MITVGWSTARLFAYVLVATIWVGGQLTLAALIPVLRSVSPDCPVWRRAGSTGSAGRHPEVKL